MIRCLSDLSENDVVLGMQWVFGVRQTSCRTVWGDTLESGALTFRGRQASVSALESLVVVSYKIIQKVPIVKRISENCGQSL